MVSKVQTFPWGYQALLGMKSSGRSPAEIAEFVQPTLDMTPFYLTSQLSSSAASGTVQNPGDTVIVAPPATSAWWLAAAMVTVTAGAIGEDLRLSVIVADGERQIRVSTSPDLVANTATSRLAHGFTFPQPWLIRPGVSVQLAVDDSTLAAARTGTVSVFVYEFTL